MKPLEERFWPKVDRSGGPGACWPWMAVIVKTGYGQICAGGKYGEMLYAHRVAYELVKGPIPAGTEIDHLCRNRACVNPAHLEAVDHRENVRRGTSPAARHAAMTACKRGHPFTEVGGGRRVCNVCRNEAQQRRRSAA